MTDLTDTTKTEPSGDQLSGAVYQLARLYELWTQDRADLMKRVSQLETQNERLEHILTQFSTVDEDFRRTLRDLIQTEVHRLSHEVGERVGSAAADAAKSALDENTRRFKGEIDNAAYTLKNIRDTLEGYYKWMLAMFFSCALLGGLLGGWAVHFATKGYRLSSDEVSLLNKGKLYKAASAHLTEAEQDRIYGLATEGKDYDKRKKTPVRADKKNKS